MRIVVLGYIVRGPIGGLAWHHLQYVLGLSRLGHEVRFIEDSDDYPSCYDPSRHVIDTDPSYGLRFIADTFAAVGLPADWAYYDAHTSRWLGPGAKDAESFGRFADIVFNISGMNPLRDWARDIPVRVFIDTDPVFVQVRHLNDDAARARAAAHTSFFTFAENVERGTAMIPDDGFRWLATRQPVVLDQWSIDSTNRAGAYTTVMQWQSYRPVEYDGKQYGMKSTSFAPYAELPSMTGAKLELALGGSDAPRDMLLSKGWKLADPLAVARTVGDFQNYLRASRGEFGVAKHGYVESNSGWFSERSANYLASGRPVITQETGFSEWLPVGEGLFSFSDPRQVVEAIESIELDYSRHSAAARRIAENYFDSRRVLTELLGAATK
jgi:hypothetical protein